MVPSEQPAMLAIQSLEREFLLFQSAGKHVIQDRESYIYSGRTQGVLWQF